MAAASGLQGSGHVVVRTVHPVPDVDARGTPWSRVGVRGSGPRDGIVAALFVPSQLGPSCGRRPLNNLLLLLGVVLGLKWSKRKDRYKWQWLCGLGGVLLMLQVMAWLVPAVEAFQTSPPPPAAVGELVRGAEGITAHMAAQAGVHTGAGARVSYHQSGSAPQIDKKSPQEALTDPHSHALRRLTLISRGANLQTVVDNANAGDVIVLSDGTYTGAGTSWRGSNMIYINKDITIRAQNPGQAVLDGQDARRVIYVARGTVTLDGLAITRGSATYVSATLLKPQRSTNGFFVSQLPIARTG